MKKSLLLLLLTLLLLGGASASNKYVDPILGSNVATGGGISNPFKSVSYARAYLVFGDTLFVKRDNVFAESVYMGNGSPFVAMSGITIAPYGTGANPVFEGGVTPTSGQWVQVPSVPGLWYYEDASLPTLVNVVEIDKKQATIGRWPKSSWIEGFERHVPYAVDQPGTITASTGSATITGSGTSFSTGHAVGDRIYIPDGAGFYTLLGTVQSLNSATSITLTGNAAANASGATYRTVSGGSGQLGNGMIWDNELAGMAPFDFDGAEIVTHDRNWVINRKKITNHSGNLVEFTTGVNQTASNYELTDGAGYFIQNKPELCTLFGEYCFDPVLKRVYINFGSDVPWIHTVKISKLAYAFLFAGTDLKVLNLEFRNYNQWGITTGLDPNPNAATKIPYPQRLAVEGCLFTHCGEAGFYATDSPYPKFLNNRFEDLQNDGIKGLLNTATLKLGLKGGEISGNVIRNVGTVHGMGLSGGNAYMGIVAFGDSTWIHHNQIDTIGSNGILFQGEGCVIERNHINYFCFRAADGGGIYTITGNVVGGVHLRKVHTVYTFIQDNIIRNGIGNSDGVPASTYEISVGLARNDGGKCMGVYLDERTSEHIVRRNFIQNIATAGIFLHNTFNTPAMDNVIVNAWRALRMRVLVYSGGVSNFTDTTVSGLSQLPFGNDFVRNTILAEAGQKHLLIEINNDYTTTLNQGRIDSNIYYVPNPSSDSLFWTKQGRVATYFYRGFASFKSAYQGGGDPSSILNAWTSYLSRYNATDIPGVQALPAGSWISPGKVGTPGSVYSSSINLQPWTGLFLISTNQAPASSDKIRISSTNKMYLFGGKLLSY